MSATFKPKKFKLNLSASFLKFVYWCGVGVLLWFAYLNVAPYALIIKMLASNIVDNSFISLLYALPILGNLFKVFGSASHWLIGFSMWLILQTVECFPGFLKRHKLYMKSVIKESENSEQYHIKDSDDPTLKTLKKYFNNFPLLSIKNARTWRNFAYVIDGLICLAIYPPIENGSFSKFFFILATRQFQLIDWQNVIFLIVTLVAVEVVLGLLFWWSQTIYYLKGAKN